MGIAGQRPQVVDSIWNGFAGYSRAVQAPDVQDQKAGELVRAALDLNSRTSEDTRRQLVTLDNPSPPDLLVLAANVRRPESVRVAAEETEDAILQ